MTKKKIEVEGCGKCPIRRIEDNLMFCPILPSVSEYTGKPLAYTVIEKPDEILKDCPLDDDT